MCFKRFYHKLFLAIISYVCSKKRKNNIIEKKETEICYYYVTNALRQ